MPVGTSQTTHVYRCMYNFVNQSFIKHIILQLDFIKVLKYVFVYLFYSVNSSHKKVRGTKSAKVIEMNI